MKYLLNNCEYTKEELLVLCKDKQKSSSGWEVDLYSFILQWFDDKDYVVGQTSGTTGTPKRMKLYKSRMKLSAKRTVEYLQLKPQDIALLSLSANYIAGKMMIVRAFEYGLNLIIIEPSMKALSTFNGLIDFAALVPYQVNDLLHNDFNVLSNIKTLIIGGAEVSEQLIADLQAVSTICYATYGMTETLSHIALKQLNGKNPEKYYKVLEGITISQDNRGCLQVVAYDEELLVTNDIVNIISHDTFEWIGRYDNIINSGGIKFIPEQIEVKIKHLIPQRFIISSKRDEKLGNCIILIIEGEEYDTEELQIRLEETLSKYEIPKEITFKEHLKVTSSGKIIR